MHIGVSEDKTLNDFGFTRSKVKVIKGNFVKNI